jgi:hypothetical protein
MSVTWGRWSLVTCALSAFVVLVVWNGAVPGSPALVAVVTTSPTTHRGENVASIARTAMVENECSLFHGQAGYDGGVDVAVVSDNAGNDGDWNRTELPVLPFDPDGPLSSVYGTPLVTECVRRRADVFNPGNTSKLRRRRDGLRLLTTERFSPRHGLTNILISVASMLMFAAVDDRAVILPPYPSRSPVDLERLLDLRATEKHLRPLNVVILTHNDTATLFRSRRERELLVSPVKARKAGLEFGSRHDAGSSRRDETESLLNQQIGIMRALEAVPYVAHRDFFLSFPTRALAPLDLCHFIKHLVYHEQIRRAASALLRAIRGRGHATFMALHVRAEEADLHLLRADLPRFPPESLAALLRESVVPIAKEANVTAIYVCAGTLPERVLRVLRSPDGGLRVLLKDDFPTIPVPVAAPNETVTSHFGAAIEALVMKHATVAVGFTASTFHLGVMAQRCPSPMRSARGEYNDLRTAVSRFSRALMGTSSIIVPQPKDARLVDQTAAGVSQRFSPKRKYEGMYLYDVQPATLSYSVAIYHGCDVVLRWCFEPD